MMDLLNMILIVLGLCVFEVVTSIDNAIINADVLSTMHKKSRKWFLFGGIIIGVFLIRGLLPWAIVWASAPQIGPVNALVSTFSNDPAVSEAIARSSPVLLVSGGTYLAFLFLYWLFIEPKIYGLIGEKFIHKRGVWFYAVASVFLAVVVWFSLKQESLMAFGAVVGSTAFFIMHGFKQNAEQREQEMGKVGTADFSKILYLEIIDAAFSIDGVLGAFAFTLSVPLILIGNGLGAIIVRNLTIRGVNKLKKYAYLKNGAMYSIGILGAIMILDGFEFNIPAWLSPIVTFITVAYFYAKSKRSPR
jgi:uncharacterized protein